MTIDRTRVITRKCAYCGAEFNTATKVKYCSAAHARNAWRLLKGGESLNAELEATDLDVPAGNRERTELYEGSCLSCARVQGEYQLTEEQARQRALVGLPRCTSCAGMVLLDRALIRSRGVA
jgi:hypothetical protein